jgi:hypothetical protein
VPMPRNSRWVISVLDRPWAMSHGQPVTRDALGPASPARPASGPLRQPARRLSLRRIDQIQV